MAKGQVLTIASGTAKLITTQDRSEKNSVAILNPNDGVLYLALNRGADPSLGGWDWKLPSQSFGAFPGPWESLGLYFLDQSGAGSSGELNVYDSDEKLTLPDIHSIGRALQARQTALDITEGAQPANPSVGVNRLWADNIGALHNLLFSGVDDRLVQTVLAQTILNKIFDASSNILSRISRTTLAADTATFSFTNIPQNYDHLLLITSAKSGGATAGGIDGIKAQIDGVTTNTYYNERLLVSGASVAAVEVLATNSAILGLIPNSLTASTVFGYGLHLFLSYSQNNGNRERGILSIFGALGSVATGGTYFGGLYAHWDNSPAVTQLDIFSGAGNLLTGSTFALYGM